jgi:cytochrome c553
MTQSGGPTRWLTIAVALGVAALASAVKAQGREQGPPVDAAQIAQQTCAACHGVDGNSPDPLRPSLAQQNAAYLERQLQQFAAQGGRRANGVMGAIAVHLSPKEMQGLAEYFSQQPLKPAMQAFAPLDARGEAIYLRGLTGKGVPACASCHGLHAEGLAPTFPRLAGQHAAYIVMQLQDFRSGSRAGDLQGMMRSVSTRLTDRDMNAVAQYVAGLR